MRQRLLCSLGFLLVAASLQSARANEGPAQISRGAALYADNCANCHGADGKRGEGFQTPIWGPGTQISKFANAQGLFEYLQVLMPFDNPAKISDAQKLDIVAYVLAQHGSWGGSDTMGPATLAGLPIK